MTLVEGLFKNNEYLTREEVVFVDGTIEVPLPSLEVCAKFYLLLSSEEWNGTHVSKKKCKVLV